MVEEIGSTLIGFAVAFAVALGILAAFPRSRKGVACATATNLCTFTLLTVIGSGLVGPFDLSPMLFWGPFSLVCAALWFHWKVKPRATP
jgi:hypothetical protein